MTEASREMRSVVIEREFAFPAERLWRALTQPHLIEEWLMKNDFKPDVGHRFNLRGEWGGMLDCEVLTIEPQKTSPTPGISRMKTQRSTSRASSLSR